MRKYAKINKKWWDSVTPIHAKSALYGLENFKKSKTSLNSIELEELGDVEGKTLLHLMSHFGMDTLSLAYKGAIATGVDISDDAIELAKKLSKEISVPARFISSDVYDLSKVLNEEFDIIFMSYGVLIWLSDIKKWAKIINKFLKKGGMFYIVELHPFTNMLSSELMFAYKYFKKGPYIDDSSGTYADWDADIQGDTYVWFYTVSDIVNALINEGLKIEFIHEFPYTFYDQFPGLMRKNDNVQYVLKDKSIQIPLLFSLKVIK